MSRYNRTNEAPQPATVPSPISYDTIDTIALQTITVLTGQNQQLSTTSVLASFSSAVGSSIVACLEVIPGLSDIATNLETVSTVADELPADAEDARTAQQAQSSTISGWSSIIGLQAESISTLANIDAYIITEASTLTVYESTTGGLISGIRDIFTAVDISTISTTIAATTSIFNEISTAMTDINVTTSSLVADAIGQSISISTLSAGAELLTLTKAAAVDFIGLSTAVAGASTALGSVADGSTANTRLIVDQSTTFANISSSVTVGASVTEFEGLSTQVLAASTTLGLMTESYSSAAVNLSTLSASVQQISSIFGAGNISAAEFEGLSTAVLANSSAIGQIWPAVCSVSIELSSLSTTVQGVSTSIGIVGNYLTLTAFEGLSSYVLTQSSSIYYVRASLCSFIAGISSLSSTATRLSTNLGNTANYVSASAFQGLSTTVLDQSTTIRAVSDSLSGFIINLSTLSSSVATVSTALGFSDYARWPEFYGLSTTVSSQSVAITTISTGAATLDPIYSSISTVTSYMSTAVNTFTIGNSSLQYGLGNAMFTGSTFAGGTSNRVSRGVEVAIGFSNTVSSGVGTAIGFCNAVVGVQTATAMGSYAAPRAADTLAIAGGYATTLNGTIIGGVPQTFMINTFGRTAAADTYTPLVFWANTGASTNSNLTISVVRSNYIMHSVSLDLQGYQGGAGGSAGSGFYRGAYQFFTYWDNTSSRAIYICDGVTGATSTLSTTLTAAIVTNRLTGAPVITATVFASTIQAGVQGAYAFAIRSSDANATNWMARLTIGELASGPPTLGIWPMDYYNQQQNAQTSFNGPLSASPTVAWTVNFNAIPFGGAPLIDNSNNIYVLNNNRFTKISPNGTSNWNILVAGTGGNACFSYDKCIIIGASQNLLKYGSYESASAPSLIWTYENFNSARTEKLTLQQAPVVDDDNIIYIRGSDVLPGGRINNIAAVNSNGSALWVYDVTPNNSIIGNIAVGKCNFIYFATSNGSLIAIDKTTGTLAWTGLSNLIGPGHQSPPVVGSDGTVYQHGSANYVYAVNGQTGTTLWSYFSGLNFINYRPFQNILVGQNIYVTYSYVLNAVNTGIIVVLNSNGVFQYSNTNSNLVGCNLLLTRLTLDANDTIYGAYSNSAVYFALNGSDLSTKWVFNIGIFGGSGASRGGVSIGGNNRAYFCGVDSNVYAIQ